MCAKFKAIGIRICVLQQFLQSVQKDEERKQRKKIETLTVHISEMATAISFKYGMYTPLAGRQLYSKFGSNRIRGHRDTKV